MDFLDFMLTMILLSQMRYEVKLKLLFELCDDDSDNQMSTDDILDMLKRIERIFSQDSSRTDLKSTIQNNFVADRRAEVSY